MVVFKFVMDDVLFAVVWEDGDLRVLKIDLDITESFLLSVLAVTLWNFEKFVDGHLSWVENHREIIHDQVLVVKGINDSVHMI